MLLWNAMEKSFATAQFRLTTASQSRRMLKPHIEHLSFALKSIENVCFFQYRYIVTKVTTLFSSELQ